MMMTQQAAFVPRPEWRDGNHRNVWGAGQEKRCGVSGDGGDTLEKATTTSTGEVTELQTRKPMSDSGVVPIETTSSNPEEK